jgi:hypothetical protein
MTAPKLDRLTGFLDDMRRDMATPAHSAMARTAADGGRSVRSLLAGGEEGIKRALQLALSSKTSLVCEHNGYQIVVVNPERAFVGTIGPGGVYVSDGENAIGFDPASGRVETAGRVRQVGPFYWDLGEADGRDGVFIVPLED